MTALAGELLRSGARHDHAEMQFGHFFELAADHANLACAVQPHQPHS